MCILHRFLPELFTTLGAHKCLAAAAASVLLLTFLTGEQFVTGRNGGALAGVQARIPEKVDITRTKQLKHGNMNVIHSMSCIHGHSFKL